MQVHASVPAAFHMTVFMTSQPADPRPDPFNPEGGGLDPGSPPVPIPAPSAACLQRELDAFKGLAAVSGPPVFQVSAGTDACLGVSGFLRPMACMGVTLPSSLHRRAAWVHAQQPASGWPAPYRGQQECRGEQLPQQEH